MTQSTERNEWDILEPEAETADDSFAATGNAGEQTNDEFSEPVGDGFDDELIADQYSGQDPDDIQEHAADGYNPDTEHDRSASPDDATAKRKKMVNIIMGVIGAAAVGAVGMTFYSLLGGSNQPQSSTFESTAQPPQVAGQLRSVEPQGPVIDPSAPVISMDDVGLQPGSAPVDIGYGHESTQNPQVDQATQAQYTLTPGVSDQVQPNQGLDAQAVKTSEDHSLPPNTGYISPFSPSGRMMPNAVRPDIEEPAIIEAVAAEGTIQDQKADESKMEQAPALVIPPNATPAEREVLVRLDRLERNLASLEAAILKLSEGKSIEKKPAAITKAVAKPADKPKIQPATARVVNKPIVKAKPVKVAIDAPSDSSPVEMKPATKLAAKMEASGNAIRVETEVQQAAVPLTTQTFLPPEKPEPSVTQRLTAIVPGRAFLQDTNGVRTDVQVGDLVSGCGRVRSINADTAVVTTEHCVIQ